MKGIYTFLTALAVTFSATAGILNSDGIQLRNELQPKKESLKTTRHDDKRVSKKAFINENASKRIAKARKADGTSSIEGVWTFSLGDYYWEESYFTSIYWDFTASYDGKYVTFEDEEEYFLPFVAEFDESTGLLSISESSLGYMYGLYISQKPFVYNYTTGGLDFQTIYGQLQGNTITFEPDNGVAWVAYDDIEETVFLGYVDAYDLEGAIKTSDNDNNEEEDKSTWEEVGYATFMDGWILPGFEIDQTDPASQYEVLLEQNSKNPNIYRLVNPYKSGPIAMYNQSTKDGYIEFDVTDPDHVTFNTNVDAGFVFAEADFTKLYVYNSLSLYAAYFEVDAATIVELFEDEIPYTTFKDGVVTLSSIEYEGEILYDACFGDQYDNLGGYYWIDVDMTTKIIFPEELGVNNIKTENNGNGTVEYFNLQGIRVESPEAGQLVIKREGSQVTKTIAR